MYCSRDLQTKANCDRFGRSTQHTLLEALLRTYPTTFKPAGLTRVKFMFIAASDHVGAVVVTHVPRHLYTM
jgi:hypothetical protein